MRMLTMGQTPHATYCATIGQTFPLMNMITTSKTTMRIERIDTVGFAGGSTIKNGALTHLLPLPLPPPVPAGHLPFA